MADRARTPHRRAPAPPPRRAGGNDGPPRAGTDARAGALALVHGVLGNGRSLADLRSDRDGAFARLGPPEQARALRLATATLRNLGRADAALSPHLRKPPPEPVRSLLRLAVTEMQVFGAPAHGVVNAAVGLARGTRHGGALSGMVNAVLRKAVLVPDEALATLPPQRLPRWLRSRLVAAWGRSAVAAIEAAHAAGAPLDLTPKAPDEAQDWAELLEAIVLPTGSLRLAADDTRAVSALPGYDAGAWWVQDAAAALPAQLLEAGPGMRVLDLCAAPGGKTMQLAATGAEVTALDLSAARMARLDANLARTGLRAKVVVADALDWAPDRPFDAILLDAPCSASGTIRRHPDMPHARREDDLAGLTALQAQLLDRVLDPASGLLRPGGRAVYCTCSLLPEEGEHQIAAALERHRAVKMLTALPEGVPREWAAPEGGLRIRPDYWPEFGGLDGFYIAALHHDPNGTEA